MPTVTDLDIPYVEDAGVRVDGRADEPAWASALVVEDFVTFQPRFDEAPTGRTVARVLADRDGISFHFTAEDPEPDKVRAGLGRRDTRFGDDWCAIYLDPSGDAQRSYLFLVTPLGVQADGTNVSGAPEDIAWDGRWTSAGHRTAAGYEVELRIPWRTVRHPADAERMGLFLFRHVARLGEKASWPRLDPDVAGLLVQEAIVGGPGPLPRDVGLDLVPELTFGRDQDGPADDRLGYAGVGPGLTVRWSPSPAFQLLGTANPDFSQVESDQAQISTNRRFALYYPEKRPFFLEGQEWFNHPFANVVYTRSMVAPLYGVRATAEAGGWTAAALHVLDAHPAPSVVESGGWTEAEIGTAPAFATVARVRRSLGADTYAGALFSDRTLANGLANRVGGVDLHARWSDRWTSDVAALGSVTSGTGRGALAPAGTASLAYGSKHVDGSVWGDLVAPGFRAENGFVTETDRVGGGTSLGATIFTNGRIVPRVAPYPLQGMLACTTDGRLKHLAFDPGVSTTLGNGGFVWVGYGHRGELYADAWLLTDRATLDLSVPWAQALSTGGGASTGSGALYDPTAPAVGWQDDVWAWVELQPVPQLSLALSASWERFRLGGDELYAGVVARARLEAFASRRVWARLIGDRDTFGHTVRGEALVAWEHSPGSAVYVGGSRTTSDPLADAGAPLAAPEWQVFAKGTWVIAI